MRTFRIAGVVVCFLASVAAVGMAQGAAGDAARGQRVQEAATASFPPKDWVKLGASRKAGSESAMYLHSAAEGPEGSVCIVGVVRRMRSGGGASVQVGPSSCHGTRGRGFWRLSTAVQRGKPSRRILGFVFSKAAARVELIGSSGGTAVMGTDKLTHKQAARVGTDSLDFLVVSDPPGDCYTFLRVVDRHSHQLGRTSLAPC